MKRFGIIAAAIIMMLVPAAAVFAVIGFVCVIFTYIGVNTFLPGVHSYA